MTQQIPCTQFHKFTISSKEDRINSLTQQIPCTQFHKFTISSKEDRINPWHIRYPVLNFRNSQYHQKRTELIPWHNRYPVLNFINSQYHQKRTELILDTSDPLLMILWIYEIEYRVSDVSRINAVLFWWYWYVQFGVPVNRPHWSELS